MSRREGSDLLPVIVTASGTTVTQLLEGAVTRVRLLLTNRKKTSQAAIIDVDDDDPALTWELESTATTFTMTVTWMPTAALVSADWVAEVRIYGAGGKKITTPSADRPILEVLPALVGQDED